MVKFCFVVAPKLWLKHQNKIKRKIRQAERERERVQESSRTLSFPAATVNQKKVPLKVKSLSFFHLFPRFSHLAFVWSGWLVKIFMCIWHSHCNLYFFLSGFCLNFYLRTERELGDQKTHLKWTKLLVLRIFLSLFPPTKWTLNVLNRVLFPCILWLHTGLPCYFCANVKSNREMEFELEILWFWFSLWRILFPWLLHIV